MEFNKDAARDLGRDIMTMCYKAIVLALTIAAICAALAIAARAADNCPLPLPFQYKTAGYKVVKAADNNNAVFTHLWVMLQYEEQTFVKHVGVAKDINEAVKEGNKWMSCIEKKSRKLPPPLKALSVESQ